MSRITLVLTALFLFGSTLPAQQQPTTPPTPKSSSLAPIPAEAAKEPNPVKPTAESITRAKKWWALDCAMCHGQVGDGKGETARDMKLAIPDFTDAATLKDRTDGEIFYIIRKGHEYMPPEGQRVTTEQNWDLVNYVRSLSKKKPEAEQKP